MERVKTNRRDIQFFSKKNDKLFIVHDERAKFYAERLEQDTQVTSFQPCEQLDAEDMIKVNPLDIRSDYLSRDTQWESNFLIYFLDGTRGVREIVDAGALKKRAIVEQLELSRRYWAAHGISNWKIVIFQKPGLDGEDADYVF